MAQAELSLETDDARVTAPDNGSEAEGRARRLAWGVVDQGMSSLTNFLIVATVAHLLGAAQLGAYSIALVTYAVALNASRGLATDPLMVRHVGESGQVWRDTARRCTGTALAVGLASGAVVTGAALLLPEPTRGAILALGLTLPALLLQDSVRFVFFVAGQGGGPSSPTWCGRSPSCRPCWLSFLRGTRPRPGSSLPGVRPQRSLRSRVCGWRPSCRGP